SCRHLTAPQMGTLLALAVFEGTFTLDDASQVTGTEHRAIGELAARSLVEVRDDRFALHPLLRQYARERAGDGVRRYQADHAEYFTAFVEQRLDRLEAGDQAAASAEVEAKLTNVLAAWRWACDMGRADLLDRAAYP